MMKKVSVKFVKNTKQRRNKRKNLRRNPKKSVTNKIKLIKSLIKNYRASQKFASRPSPKDKIPKKLINAKT